MGISRYRVRIEGERPLIHHSLTAGLDTTSPIRLEINEIARKKGIDRTDADEAKLRELECQNSLWLDEDGRPTIPDAALRRAIEDAARKLKQGPKVRSGLVIWSVDKFEYDEDALGTTVEELGRSAQFTVPVRVQRQAVLRTRAKFDTWACEFTIEADDELVDERQLTNWIEIAGARLGLGDWRPEKSGTYGRFTLDSLTKVKVKD